jgi:hypothetical protein
MKMMKKIKTLLMLTALVIGLSVSALSVAPVAAATVNDYSGAWYTTDINNNEGDSNFINFEVLTGSSLTPYLPRKQVKRP